jgi:hypothetical protein
VITGNTRTLYPGEYQRLLDALPAQHRERIMRDLWELSTTEARARGDGGYVKSTPAGTVTARRKKPVIAKIAIARELAGWCWSLAVMDD